MCAGTLKARVEIEKSLNKSMDINLEDVNYRDPKDDFKPAINSNNMTMGEMEALIAQKDQLHDDQTTLHCHKLMSLIRYHD